MQPLSYTSTNSLVGRFSTLLALIVTVLIPAMFAAFTYEHHATIIQTKADIIGEDLSRLITSKAEPWPPRANRLQLLLGDHSLVYEYSPHKRILGLNGEVFLDDNTSLAFPILTRQATIYDRSTVVGTVEVLHSMSDLLPSQVLFILCGAILGTLVSFCIKLPLKKLQESLEHLGDQKEQLTTTLTSIGEGVIATNGNGDISIFNKQAELITGYKAESVVGRHFDDFFKELSDKPDEKRKSLVQRALWEEEIVTVFEDIIVKPKNSAQKNIFITGSPIKGNQEEKSGVVFILRDITEQKKTEEELRKVEQLETLGFFAGGLAHDFNNLLTTINNNVSRVIHAPDALSHQIETLSGVCEAVLHAKRLTNQLLTFAKGGNPVLKVISLADVVRSSSDFILRGSHLRLHYEIPPDLWNVKGDEGQIAQVIQNLIINAVQALDDEHGTLTVRCRNIEEDTNRSADRCQDGKWVEIAIEDTGSGIPQESAKHIFTPYFTTKESGSGLGLSVCYSIAKKHNGTITFESVEGQGTTFFFRLPACLEKITKKPEATLSPLKGSGRILVMDDDLALLESVANTLQDLGYHVTTAHDGEDAVNQYKDAFTAGIPFDLVLLDLTVPGKMGGREAVQFIRKFDPAVKAVVSSGYSDDQVISRYKNYGFCGTLNKPYQTYHLSKVVRETISSVLPDFADLPEYMDSQGATRTPIQPTEESSDNQEPDILPAQVDPTYYTCKAELSSGVLHSIRNALTPIFLDVQRLKEVLQKIDLSSYNEIVNEFTKPDLPEERKLKLIRFLTLSHELLDQQLGKIFDATDLVSKSILRVGKVLEKRDGYLEKDHKTFTLPELIDDAVSLLPESTFQKLSVQIDTEMESLGSMKGKRLLFMLITHKVLKHAVDARNRAGGGGNVIRITAKCDDYKGNKTVHLKVGDSQFVSSEKSTTEIEHYLSNNPNEPMKEDLHFCATCMATLKGSISITELGEGYGNRYHLLFPVE